VVLVAIAALAGLLSLLLAVPLVVSFRLQGIEPFEGQVRIRWLFGLVRFRIRVPGVRRRRRRGARTEASNDVRATRGRRDGRARALAILGQAAFRRRATRLVRDLVRAAHPSEIGVRMRLGLGDPADTGRLWAIVGPLNAAALGLRNAEVRIEPEFLDPALELEIQGRLLLVPLQLLALAVAFALSPSSIRAWRTLRARHA
jgi:hypothetical protein